MKRSLLISAAILGVLMAGAQRFDPDFNPIVANDGSPEDGLLLDDGRYIAGGVLCVSEHRSRKVL